MERNVGRKDGRKEREKGEEGKGGGGGGGGGGGRGWGLPIKRQCFIQKGGRGGGISHPKGQISHPKNPENKKFIIMILTQPYNLQSDLPVLLFKNVKISV